MFKSSGLKKSCTNDGRHSLGNTNTLTFQYSSWMGQATVILLSANQWKPYGWSIGLFFPVCVQILPQWDNGWRTWLVDTCRKFRKPYLILQANNVAQPRRDCRGFGPSAESWIYSRNDHIEARRNQQLELPYQRSVDVNICAQTSPQHRMKPCSLGNSNDMKIST